MGLELRPWQRRFLRAAFAPGVRTAALSLPRGNGKSSLCAHLAHRALTPGDPLFRPGLESHIVSASIGQARRTVFALLREFVESDPAAADYSIAESVNIAAVRHKATNTRVSVMAPSGKRAQGLVRAPFLFCDEPGSFEVVGGQLLHDAIETAHGKPGTDLRVFYIGTLAPAMSGWWHTLVSSGSNGSTHVTALVGRRERWATWQEIRRCNPLMATFADSRARLLEERDKARRDSRHKSAFLSYRLNAPTPDEASVLLSVDEWVRVCRREVGDCAGRPIVGVDLGAGRAWSAIVALWPSGRIEARAVAPGIPSIEAQEKRDRVPTGTYAALVEAGTLIVDAGLRVQSVSRVVDAIRPWRPLYAVMDRFRLPMFLDERPRFPVVPRVVRWSESTADIEALRRLALDGPLSCEPASRGLVAASLSVAMVSRDDANNCRLVKRGANNEARDDVAAALTLAAGALARVPERSRGAYLGVV